ncbi:MAG: NPCBM/NEW2 domain-containing protein [Paludibacteraceae bacterium]|nr:NPCBM/NEW2 domain-containing protein [Paludibacteraceae bacterium]
MKKILLSFIALIALMLTADAQVVFVDTFQPIKKSGSGHYRPVTSKEGNQLRLSCYKMGSGFSLDAPGGGLIGSTEPNEVEFDIKGEYVAMTFVLAPFIPNSAGDGHYSIVTITGDGKRLLDDVVFDHDALRMIKLDVTDVNILKISVLQGSQNVGFGNVKLWKAGQKILQTGNPLNSLPKGAVRLVNDLRPHFIRHTGWVNTLDTSFLNGPREVPSIRINRKEFNSGLQFTANEGFMEDMMGYSYFWTNKRYDKISFIVGPRDNQSSNASAWLIVKADKKVVYEGVVTQKDLAQQIVVDIAGAELVSFHSQRRSSDFLGSITFGVVDIIAYPPGYTDIPTPGILNVNKDKISKLPDICPLLSNIRPFSVRGVSKEANTMFYGESRYITFSMGGTKYNEGLLLTTGNTLMGDMIDAYAAFDLGGEFDWISFDAGCLSKNHILDDDALRIYADDQLVFDKTIYCTWPNQHYEIPVNKCRTLRFEKMGNGKKKQTIIGVGDIILYRGKPVANNIFEHDIPECPYEIDLIDLCGKPYFHYVGRYVSSLTNFSMDDCFHDGSTITKYFQMKDGRQINKGIMLETNIPLGLENVTVTGALFTFLTGAGANLSSSDVAAETGTTGGATGIPMGAIGLLLFDKNQKQASVAAFNPYGQYESCTFTVACKSEHVDEMATSFGDRSEEVMKNPVKLNIFADRVLVGEVWLNNKMEPTTVTVPIRKCKQLMFWLECGDTRSGQYVIYDAKLSKAPTNIPIPEKYSKTPEATTGK